MKILSVDEKTISKEALLKELKSKKNNNELIKAKSILDAANYLTSNSVDIIIFNSSADSDKQIDTKNRDSIQKLLDVLSVQKSEIPSSGVAITTFGCLKLYKDGKEIELTSPCRKVLSAIVDRYPSALSNEDIFTRINGDKNYDDIAKRTNKTNIYNLRKCLIDNEILDLVLETTGTLKKLNRKGVWVDCFEALYNDNKVVTEKFNGEYLKDLDEPNYEILSKLEAKKSKIQ